MQVIFKNDYQRYEKSLKILKMDKLQDRMERLSLSFAKKCLKHRKFSNIFHKNLSDATIKVRNREKYFVNKARTERFKYSSIPFLQRKLDESAKQERKQLKAMLQVNRVSNVDPITFRK